MRHERPHALAGDPVLELPKVGTLRARCVGRSAYVLEFRADPATASDQLSVRLAGHEVVHRQLDPGQSATVRVPLVKRVVEGGADATYATPPIELAASQTSEPYEVHARGTVRLGDAADGLRHCLIIRASFRIAAHSHTPGGF